MSKGNRLPFESEVLLLLLKNSLGSVPFNVIVSAILCAELFYNGASATILLPWFLVLLLVCVVRMLYARVAIRRQYYLKNLKQARNIFVFLGFLTGAVWGSSYFLFLPFARGADETIVLLVLGGIASGGLVSLSVSLPAYSAFLAPIFAPIILYNIATMSMHNMVLATLITLFVCMILITARFNTDLFLKMFRLSTQKDELIIELALSNKKLEASNEEVRVLSITDPLTTLHNRRYFDRTLPGELSRARRNEYPLNLMLIDLDNFKFINDSYGHPYGDEYLVFVASLLKSTMRRVTDLVVRLGGDEFAVILSNMPLEEVQTLAEHIRNEFAKVNRHPEITLSIGIIHVIPSPHNNINTIVAAADEMLYRAKEHGKNRVVLKSI